MAACVDVSRMVFWDRSEVPVSKPDNLSTDSNYWCLKELAKWLKVSYTAKKVDIFWHFLGWWWGHFLLVANIAFHVCKFSICYNLCCWAVGGTYRCKQVTHTAN